MASYKCLNCSIIFEAKEADRKRGWARFCSKSCKAKEQTRLTGRGAPWQDTEHEEGMIANEAGWDGHKNAY